MNVMYPIHTLRITYITYMATVSRQVTESRKYPQNDGLPIHPKAKHFNASLGLVHRFRIEEER